MTTTPYNKIQNVFYSSFQSKTEIPIELEEQLFFNAVGDFELNLHEIEYSGNIVDGDCEILENLPQSKINLLGKLMYKHQLQRERDRIMKLNNIVGRDIKLTGMSDTKQVLNKMYDNLLYEIETVMHKLKENTYYE